MALRSVTRAGVCFTLAGLPWLRNLPAGETTLDEARLLSVASFSARTSLLFAPKQMLGSLDEYLKAECSCVGGMVAGVRCVMTISGVGAAAQGVDKSGSDWLFFGSKAHLNEGVTRLRSQVRNSLHQVIGGVLYIFNNNSADAHLAKVIYLNAI